MNKQDLIDAIASATDISKAKAKDVIDALLEAIKKSVKAGKAVQLVGFGTWKRAARKARTGRNPQTGKEIKIAARKVVRFVVGKEFKDLVNK